MRVIRPELLDSVSEADARANLADLVRINRYLGGYWTLRRAWRHTSPPRDFTVLDVGAASGDNGRAIRRSYPGARVVSLDRVVRNLREASEPRVAADAFRLPFADGSFDYVFTSLFLHHFTEDDTAALLAEFCRVARRGIVMTDLERSRLSRWFLPATRWLFGWSPVTVHDGTISVDAAYRAPELLAVARRAGLRGMRVRRHWPWFRLSLVTIGRDC